MKNLFLTIICNCLLLTAVAQTKSLSWLSDKKNTTNDAQIDKFIQNLSGSMIPMICEYDGNKLNAKHIIALKDGVGDIAVAQSNWKCSVTKKSADKDSYDVEIKFEVTEGVLNSAGVAVAYNFDNWDFNNYIHVPAMVYGGNRFRLLNINYPPHIPDAKDRPLDMPITTTNIPHLNKDGSPAKIELYTGNVSTPLMSFFNGKDKRGFIMLTTQDTQFGNNGLIIEENATGTGKKMSFVVSAPAVRELRQGGTNLSPTNDKGADWKKGDAVVLKFKLYNFACADMPAFFDMVFNNRKALSGKNKYPMVTPFSATSDFILKFHDEKKWLETDKTAHINNRPGDNNPFHFQLGWGGQPTYCTQFFISQNDERNRKLVLTLDNFVFPAQAKNGLFYAMNRWGEFFGDGFANMSEDRSVSLIRRSTDVLFFTLNGFNLWKHTDNGKLIKPEWEAKLRKCADAIIAVYEKYGQLGQFIDVETMEMETNGSTAGAGAGSALAVVAKYFNEPKYLEAAKSITEMYIKRDFMKGYSGGGPAEILQAPDSESAYDMVESCVSIYEATGEKKWIDYAKLSANMLSTWVVSYDYKFPKGTPMEKAGTQVTGSTFASSQNNHFAPGFYVLSGDFLFRLYRATGDARYMELYKDHSHNIVQYVGAPYNPLRKELGHVTERVQLSDWEGGDVGSVHYSDSNMAWETLAAISSMQAPGIYLLTDDSTLFVIDHVEATVLKRDSKSVTLKIKNPTLYDAEVSVCAESKANMKKPLPMNAFLDWQRVKVEAGKETTITIDN